MQRSVGYRTGRAVGFVAAWGIVFGLCVFWAWVLVKFIRLAESWGW